MKVPEPIYKEGRSQKLSTSLGRFPECDVIKDEGFANSGFRGLLASENT